MPILIMYWKYLAIALLAGTVWLQQHRIEAIRTEAAEFRASVAAAGKAQEERTKQVVAAAADNAKKARTGYETNLARVSNYYINRLRDGDPGPGSVPAAGTDTGSVDGDAPELVTCRGRLARLEGIETGCAVDALTLGTLQKLLRDNGHPVK